MITDRYGFDKLISSQSILTLPTILAALKTSSSNNGQQAGIGEGFDRKLSYMYEVSRKRSSLHLLDRNQCSSAGEDGHKCLRLRMIANMLGLTKDWPQRALYRRLNVREGLSYTEIIDAVLLFSSTDSRV